jgi:hypothetical protein
LNSSRNDVDAYAELGSPVGPVTALVIIQTSVVIGSTSVATPALDVSGFAANSLVTIANEGRIQGKGGDGGLSFVLNLAGLSTGGGGGGGAGTTVGAGVRGDLTVPDTLGDDGTADMGGAGGVQTDGGAGESPRSAAVGQDGGDALKSGSLQLIVYNGNGEIFGGGGGGGGGGWDEITALTYGGDGGAPGAAGDNADTAVPWVGANGGAAGKAIDGTDVTFNSGGSSPNVEGAVG